VKGLCCPGKPGIEDVPTIVPIGVGVMRTVTLIARVIGREFIRTQNLSLHTQSMEQQMMIGEIIEGLAASILHRLADEAEDAPGPAFPVTPECVKGLPDIGPVPR